MQLVWFMKTIRYWDFLCFYFILYVYILFYIIFIVSFDNYLASPPVRWNGMAMGLWYLPSITNTSTLFPSPFCFLFSCVSFFPLVMESVTLLLIDCRNLVLLLVLQEQLCFEIWNDYVVLFKWIHRYIQKHDVLIWLYVCTDSLMRSWTFMITCWGLHWSICCLFLL